MGQLLIAPWSTLCNAYHTPPPFLSCYLRFRNATATYHPLPRASSAPLHWRACERYYEQRARRPRNNGSPSPPPLYLWNLSSDRHRPAIKPRFATPRGGARFIPIKRALPIRPGTTEQRGWFASNRNWQPGLDVFRTVCSVVCHRLGLVVTRSASGRVYDYFWSCSSGV